MEASKELKTAPGSALALIRQTREELAAEEQPLLIALIAYDEKVALRFDYPEDGFKQIRRALGGPRPGQRRLKQDDEAELNAMADVMVTCCTGVVEVQDGKPEGEWPSIDPEGRDLRVTRRLADLLGIEVSSEVKKVGRYILRHLYSPHAHKDGVFRGDPALLADGSTLQEWLDRGGARVTERTPGE